jgi:hypothetical protein
MLRSALSSFDYENAAAIETVDGGGAVPANGAEANCLFVGQNSKGAWVVRDRLGLKAGIFRSRASALHFAKDEARASNLQFHEMATQVELDIDASSA